MRQKVHLALGLSGVVLGRRGKSGQKAVAKNEKEYVTNSVYLFVSS